eukprot:Lankesteria_metandrocarpae@DN3947_c0_g1_i1.p1
MTEIRVDIDQESGRLSVFNNGDSIPIEVHKEHKIHVPELIFGHLLTSDNYDDSEARVTGGRNGYGAKLTNIFSTEMVVECCDTKKKFRMKWNNNMSRHTDARITDAPRGTAPFVKVSFKPDLPKFGMAMLDDDCVALLTKRVYDIAGTTGAKVWLNGKRIVVKDFKSYVDLYFYPETSKDVLKVHEKQDRWEFVVTQSVDGVFQQVSFVNSICTAKGGTHVSHIADPLVASILKHVTKKNKGGMELKAHHVKSHVWVFVNALVVNPQFDSQAKETMTSRPSTFGSKCEILDKTFVNLCKSNIVESVLMWARVKQQVDLQKKMKATGVKVGRDRITGIPKLEDANDAGSKHAQSCTLIVTEGDSAKTSCLAGLSVVGRDRYGIFPLRGKLLNVRDASFKQQIGNAEIQNVMSVMGLKVNEKDRCDTRGLRYGSLMMMTDQDFDGSHIKGLIINMVHYYWPHLAHLPGFLKEFATPIVKVSRRGVELSFFSMPEYEEWKSQNNDGQGWKIRYYKGLGTSTDREFKEYFSELEQHQLDFKYEGPEDDEHIDLAFHPKRVEDRKKWLQAYVPGEYIDHNNRYLSFKEFVNKELILFSRYDVERSIPSLVDGFKPGQRKVMFAAIKKNIKNELKVVQLAGYVAEKSCYHHGEQSLQSTIIGMAQTFVGSNNANIFFPSGQFGSRKEGGKDCSAPRYIFTRLSDIARVIFHPDDDPLLHYQVEEGVTIEPKHYVPVIPLTLVNGAEGIGTGWSSYVPNFNPRDIVANLQRLIRGESMEPMTPWYRHFKGTIERQEKGNGFDAIGTISKTDEDTVVITELPIRFWTQNYKDMLEEALESNVAARDAEEKESKENSTAALAKKSAGTRKTKKQIEEEKKASKKKRGADMKIIDYRDNSTHDDIHFTVKLSKEEMEKAEHEGLEKYFKLRRALNLTNMTLFNSDGKIYRYATELDVMRDFANLRLEFYVRRKEYQLVVLRRDCAVLANRLRFIQLVNSGDLKVQNRQRLLIIKDLLARSFDPMSELDKTVKKLSRANVDVESGDDAEGENAPDDEAQTAAGVPSVKDFDYLLGMAIWSLTEERITELDRQRVEKEKLRDDLNATSPEQLWMIDLDAVSLALDRQDQEDQEQRLENSKFRRHRRASLSGMPLKNQRGKGRAGPKAAAKKRTPAKKPSKRLVDDSEHDETGIDNLSISDSFVESDDSDDSFSGGKSKTKTPAKRQSPVRKGRAALSTAKSTTASALKQKVPIVGRQPLPPPAESKQDVSPRPLTSFTLLDRLKNKVGPPVATEPKSQMTLEQMFSTAGIGQETKQSSRTSSPCISQDEDDIPLATRKVSGVVKGALSQAAPRKRLKKAAVASDVEDFQASSASENELDDFMQNRRLGGLKRAATPSSDQSSGSGNSKRAKLGISDAVSEDESNSRSPVGDAWSGGVDVSDDDAALKRRPRASPAKSKAAAKPKAKSRAKTQLSDSESDELADSGDESSELESDDDCDDVGDDADEDVGDDADEIVVDESD